jgi:hypothetical protein
LWNCRQPHIIGVYEEHRGFEYFFHQV